MKLRALSSLLLACIAVSLACAQAAPEKQKFSPSVRKFRLPIPSPSKTFRQEQG